MGFDKLNQPVGFDRLNQPVGFDKLNQPVGFDKLNQPAGFDKLNQPAGFDKLNQPAGFDKLNQPVLSAAPEARHNIRVSFEPSKWTQIIAADPQHSHRYIQRFKMMAANGADLLGEARTVDAMAPRNARILDAGCGPGRHGGWLQERGHTVVGVDGDPVLIDEARREHPEATWVVCDLAELDLPARGIEANFDVILCAGNVMGFLAPSTRVDVLRRLGGHLAPEGRAIIGFGAGRGYEFPDFFADAQEAGLNLQLALSTWDLRPFDEDSTFLVAVLGRA